MNWGMRMAAAALLCVALLCVTAGWGADWKALKPQGYVSDFAGALDSTSRSELNAYGAALEKATGAHLSLVLIGSLQKEPVDAVAHTILQSWSAGASAPDDRALLLIAVDDRRDSLVAGKALQSILNADTTGAVLSDARPALARKQYGQALMAAADEIGGRISAARGKTVDVHLPKRARRTLGDSIPWPLAAGAIPVLALLTWLLRRPHHRHPPEEHA